MPKLTRNNISKAVQLNREFEAVEKAIMSCKNAETTKGRLLAVIHWKNSQEVTLNPEPLLAALEERKAELIKELNELGVAA